MLLRPRQKQLVDRAVEALHTHGNTLAVAPTGAGKTIMLSATIGQLSPVKTCVLAHRQELTLQNQAKFRQVNPHLSTSVLNAWEKSWQGDTTFAMVQTLARKNNLEAMPPLDLLVIDEAHHARATTYTRIVKQAKALNPHVKLLGMTATPNRGDKKGLRVLFDNVCDQITLQELILSGHLVKPRTFIKDIGAQQKLQELKPTSKGEDDLEAVGKVMDTQPQNEAVVEHWKEKAGDRQTVIFCATLTHACHLYDVFIQENILTVIVHWRMHQTEREQALQTYTSGQAQVIINVSVLTEGWDHPPTSCVVLLRPCSYKCTFIQMVGRGLRSINQEEYPGVIKTDCLILDFGTASLTHGSLEQMVVLEDRPPNQKAKLAKVCPCCKATVPSNASICPLCQFVFSAADDRRTLGADDFILREIDLLRNSPFEWVPLKDEQDTLMASGFGAWATVQFRNSQWYAIGGLHKGKTRLLAIGDKSSCLATADDWMNRQETDDSAHKARSWLALPPTSNQFQYLPDRLYDYNLTRYEASLLMTLRFNADAIEQLFDQGVSL